MKIVIHAVPCAVSGNKAHLEGFIGWSQSVAGRRRAELWMRPFCGGSGRLQSSGFGAEGTTNRDVWHNRVQDLIER